MVRISRHRAERERRNIGLRAAADDLGVNKATLSKIERGLMKPGTSLARQIFTYYRGRVPLGAIYDPVFDLEVLEARRERD